MTSAAKSVKVAFPKFPEAKIMSSIYFVEVSSLSNKQARSSYRFRKRKTNYFPWKIFLTPVALSVVGFVLIYLSVFSESAVLAGGSPVASSYPPKLSDLVPDYSEKDVLLTDLVVSDKADSIALSRVNLASVNINNLSLSGTVRWPVRGRITTYYSSYHPGIDIAAPYGSNVVSTMEGVVVEVGRLSWGFGSYLVIQHKNNYRSLYAHLSTINVAAGDVVGLRTVVGRIGTSGNATGPHLHFEIFHNNSTINPFLVLPR